MNTGAMLAILTTITLDDYYTDQIQEKRQKMKNYAGSMKSIGDNVRLWGGSLTDTLRDSGRTDLEQSILQGAQELPIYIFAQVIRRQAGSTTKYQKRMIDIAFQNLNMLPFSREEYDQALCGDAKAWQIMKHTVGLSPSYCGTFWHRHPGCQYATMPKTRIEFWQAKFDRTVEHDQENYAKLEELGWKVCIAWECEIKSDFEQVISKITGILLDS